MGGEEEKVEGKGISVQRRVKSAGLCVPSSTACGVVGRRRRERRRRGG